MTHMKKSARPLIRLLMAFALACNLSACAAQAQEHHLQPAARTGFQSKLAYEQNTIDIVKKYGKSVVAINVTVQGVRVNPYKSDKQLPPEVRQFFKQFGIPVPQQFGGPDSQPQKETERAAGSGFVADARRQILTNFHVVSDALESDSTQLKKNASITVQFPGGQPLPVRVVGINQSYDLALLQLEHPQQAPADAIPIPLANSDDVRVGEKAIAIGNPFTLQSTVTMGIVSAINRDQAALVSGVPIPFIQTDAAINPGNSGGPLLNSRGQVIGINDEILANDGAFVGVGLAIPSNLMRQSFPRLKAGGYYQKAMMGILVESLAHYPKVVKQQLNLPDHGLMIVRVKSHSPAEKAGLQGSQFSASANGSQWAVGGDIILRADGMEITHAQTLQKLVFSKEAGATIPLVIWHDGHKKSVKVTLEEPEHRKSGK